MHTFQPADLSLWRDMVFSPFNVLHYTCFIVPKDQIEALPAANHRVAAQEDVLLYVAARAMHLAWGLGLDNQPSAPICPNGIVMDWRDSKHRRSDNQASAHLVRLRWFHRAKSGPRLYIVRQAIIDAMSLAIDEGLLKPTVLLGGVVQLDDEC